MKIILVINDTQRRNLVFVTDTLKVYSLPEAIKAVQSGKIQSVHTVKTGAGTYLRSNPNTTNKDNLDFIAHSSYQLYNAIDVTINWNSSVGIAQVTLDTAKHVIRSGYYNPNPKDPKLSKERVGRVSRQYLYKYVSHPKHSIYFAAARIRQIIDYWAQDIDLSYRPEIIGTLYSQGLGDPKSNPTAIPRGIQIQKEFYPLAKSILFQK